ncbi:hypothetical protein CCS79_01400 [Clostridium diolis]|uniref:prepilin-type N-terminal cleavage/methylation domain-containing protein n=1 Tax=Clostridium diolis TaxID=223919 RepID=UPI000B4025B3|nr:prepilin-type N-terminal cleavage/methylation domain-containing protein [Clostridium diolis]OVE70657.1 hypothetical protein CCS79_01400 [Clostridium diolis]
MSRKKSGFTLMEMIIVVALIVIVIFITSSIFITGNRVFSDSDAKSTLQMDARNIQEELTSIGMQAICITDIEIDKKDKDANDNILYVDKNYYDIKDKIINKIQISGYDKDTEYSQDEGGSYHISDPNLYDIGFNGKTLSLGSKPLSNKVKSFIVIPEDTNNSFANTSSVEFDIILSERNVEYPINIKLTFRNKNK